MYRVLKNVVVISDIMGDIPPERIDRMIREKMVKHILDGIESLPITAHKVQDRHETEYSLEMVIIDHEYLKQLLQYEKKYKERN